MKQVSKIHQRHIYTIGHGTRDIATFIDLIKRYSIELLIDVRTIPYSRFNPQYRQSNLVNSLKAAQTDYLFLGKELGGRPDNPELYLNGKPNYSAMRNTPEFKVGIAEVSEYINRGIKVTLMCSESNQDECHRKHLIADVLASTELDIFHIDKSGALAMHIPQTTSGLFESR